MEAALRRSFAAFGVAQRLNDQELLVDDGLKWPLTSEGQFQTNISAGNG